MNSCQERYKEAREKLAKLPSGNISTEEIGIIVDKTNKILDSKEVGLTRGELPGLTEAIEALEEVSQRRKTKENKMNPVSGEAQVVTARAPVPLDELNSAIEQLATEVTTLFESVSLSHTKLYGDYNFPPTSDEKEKLRIDTPGRINQLTRDVQGILGGVRNAFAVAESIEQKS